MIKAYVSDRYGFVAGGVDVFVVRSYDDPGAPQHLLRMRDDGGEWVEIDPLAADGEPTLRLPHEAATAVVSALTAHYGGVDDVRTLRADYDAERKRVDKLTDTVSGIAAALARMETR